MQTTPDYLVIGHVTKDILAGGREAPGGTALYSALTARRLGLNTAIVTSLAAEDDALLDGARAAGIRVHRAPSEYTTTFSNIYNAEGTRVQVLGAQASMLRADHVPDEWLGARIVHLGPVAQETHPELVSLFAASPLLGITPQGLMRYWDAHGHVTQQARPVPNLLANLPPSAVLVLSVEDLGHDEEEITRYSQMAPLVVITHASHPARLYSEGECVEVHACRSNVVDPTGAGDVFATGFFVCYTEEGNTREAVRFAHAAAACNIEGFGTAAVPNRAQVEERLAQCGEQGDAEQGDAT